MYMPASKARRADLSGRAGRPDGVTTASSTCAAANLAAVAAHPPVLVTGRTGTIASGHAASTSARLYPLGSSSSADQITPRPAKPTKEVMLSPEHPTPEADTRAGHQTIRPSLSCDPGGKPPHSTPSTILHRRRHFGPGCSASK